jgi:hypothetical protein
MKAKSSSIFTKALFVFVLLFSLAAFPQSAYAQTLCVAPVGAGGCHQTIQEAIDAANAGDIINIEAGTYFLASTVNLNKAGLTLQGVGVPLIQVSGTGYRFLITAEGVKIDGVRIEKTDKTGVQNIIGIQASNTSITNNEIYGQFVIGDGEVSRAMEMSGGISGLVVNGNTIHHLRQPAYINTPVLGTISNNYVYGTKGWVIAGGGVTFIGNTWGTGTDVNVYDIAVINGVIPGYYPDIVAMSNANNGAVIEDQRVSPAVLSTVYVDAATSYSTDLGGLYHPYSSITPAIARVIPGGTIHVAAGTYIENIVVNKSVNISGAGQENTIVMPAVTNANPCTGSSLCGGTASNVFLVQAHNVIIHDLTVNGDNPALTSNIVRDGADLDARNGIIKDTNVAYNGLEVYNTTVRNIYLRGIYSTGGTFNFHDNNVTNVQGDAYSIAMFAWYGPGVMANNTVTNANDAIAANWSHGIQFLNNTISNSGTGVHTDNSGTGTAADLIQGNSISDCKADGYGIFVFVPYVAPTVNGNTISNCTVGLSAWGQANPVTTQFTNNTVTGPATAPGSVGVYITTDQIGYGYNDVSVNFTGNHITGFETGIYLTADEQTWSPGWTPKTITAAFSNNNISGNLAGLDIGGTGNYIASATNNWWGSASGPGPVGSGTGNTIAEGVPYTPWLCYGTDLSTDPGFQPLLTTDCTTFTGFSQPIDMNAINIAKAGQTIPVKWRLTDASGMPISDPAYFGGLMISNVSCESTSGPTDAIETYSGSSGLQYLGDGYWQFNWKTPKTYANSCRKMHIQFQGGLNSPEVMFQFK